MERSRVIGRQSMTSSRMCRKRFFQGVVSNELLLLRDGVAMLQWSREYKYIVEYET
jgi:hypothetical protein